VHTRVTGGALHGIDVHLVQVEADISSGLPATRTVGLPEAAAREGNERVRAAIQNSGFAYPCKRILINLAPADLRKKGSALDLAMAVAIVSGSQGIDASPLAEIVLYAELGLDGGLRPVPGALAAAMAVRKAGSRGLVVATDNAAEAAAIGGLVVLPAASLREVIAHLTRESPLVAFHVPPGAPVGDSERPVSRGSDLSEVRGQSQARRALEIAAAGGHNLLLVGPPGSGKTMLARCLPGILPPLGPEEAIEVTRVHGAVGTGLKAGLVRERPFRSPHHTVSSVALAGGGALARPGEVSLAHQGVLFLDELPEFRREAIEVLRQPMEEGFVTVARAARTLRYPAAFMMVAAMNPCRCGFLGSRSRECICTPPQIAQYRNRVSGPLLDRIDLHVEVPAVAYRDMSSEETGESSAAVGTRVMGARDVQRTRSPEIPLNARLPAVLLRKHCRLDAEGRRLMEAAVTKLGLSARAHDRVLKVARTIADLAAGERITRDYLAEAIQYRMLDRSPENR